MNRIKEYIPAFVDFRGVLEEHEFDTLAELLAIPFVKKWEETKGFYRFSYSDGRLMCELQEGYSWWVVGHLLKSVYGLPEWKAKYKADVPDEEEV